MTAVQRRALAAEVIKAAEALAHAHKVEVIIKAGPVQIKVGGKKP